MEADWSRLTYYPHYSSSPGPGGERYAYRQAMLTRLNGIEGTSIVSRLAESSVPPAPTGPGSATRSPTRA